ncbi:F-box protein At2g26160-like [Abrus precatorius]|uniref:F-box protein At2g26160-like n=1 Tax=Abrus precatorius TaxID=3816 RepID=A0A8B8MME0_ABRPR|nr:F-box protein At2g26160-like [Abrus precatorius]
MCSSASHSEYLLVIIYSCQGKIAFCKSATWVELFGATRSYCDIVFKNNYLYALAQDRSVEGWDICQHVPRKILDVKPTMEIDEELETEFSRDLYSIKSYLVKSEGEMLLVIRYIGNFVNDDGAAVDEGYLLSSMDIHPLLCPYQTKHFSVYKFDFRKIKWEKVRSLPDQVLCLGANESMSISVRAFSGCQPNSIYFTDDRWFEMNLDYLYGGHYWACFNLLDRTFNHFSPSAYKLDPPPIWVIPTPDSYHDMLTM